MERGVEEFHPFEGAAPDAPLLFLKSTEKEIDHKDRVEGPAHQHPFVYNNGVIYIGR